jgi:hypothetical protein
MLIGFGAVGIAVRRRKQTEVTFRRTDDARNWWEGGGQWPPLFVRPSKAVPI